MNSSLNILRRITLLATLGIVVSLYLVYHHENVVGGYNIGQSFCNMGGSFNCDEVAKSNYSSLFGFPVAAFGLCYFLVLSAFAVFVGSKKTYLESALSLISVSALVALVPSLLLLLVSIFQIKKFCLFCLLLDLVIICILFLTLKFLSRQNLSEVFAMFGTSKIFLLLALPISLLVSFSSPWAFRNFVLEAALKESVIAKIYETWQIAPLQDLVLNFENDGLKKDFYLGSDNPKVTLVEFSDFQCPFCKLASIEVKALLKRWPNQLRVVFKNFPLDKLCNLRFEQAPHQLSCQAAVMARCASVQNAENFWRFHDALFDLEYEEWTLERLLKTSSQLGVDQFAIDKCVAEGNALTRVRTDVELGNAIGVDSTPSFFLNGKRLFLSRLDQLEKIVEMVLEK